MVVTRVQEVEELWKVGQKVQTFGNNMNNFWDPNVQLSKYSSALQLYYDIITSVHTMPG